MDTVQLYCYSGLSQWQLTFDQTGTATATDVTAALICDPLLIVFDMQGTNAITGLPYSVTVAVTPGPCGSGCGSGSGSGSGTGSRSGGGIFTACCPAGLPATLHVTLAQEGGNCPLLDGVVVTLTWNSGISQWVGTANCNGGGTVAVRVACSGTDCTGLVIAGATSGAACSVSFVGNSSNGAIVGTCSCSPLSVEWDCVVGVSPPGPSCCEMGGPGILTATITE